MMRAVIILNLFPCTMILVFSAANILNPWSFLFQFHHDIGRIPFLRKDW